VCGRFVSSSTPEAIAAYFGAEVDTPTLPANFNVAPTTDIYAVVATPDGTPTLRTFHWGLVPSWAKDVKVGSKMINARAETVAEKPAFKPLLRKQRLLVPMDGFYEWKVVPGQKAKQPMFIHSANGEPLAVAGLWATWRDRENDDPDAAWLHSCTLITTSNNETMALVHNRMPVLVPASRWQEWLDPTNDDVEALQKLLVPAPEDLLTMHPVSTAVNNVRNRGEELIEPIEEP
jgi:putative SOS response-associated peptidase YedK